MGVVGRMCGTGLQDGVPSGELTGRLGVGGMASVI